jgi:hypothetical protein
MVMKDGKTSCHMFSAARSMAGNVLGKGYPRPASA